MTTRSITVKGSIIWRALLVLAVLLASAVTAPGLAGADDKKITVAAAASLTAAFKEIAANFEKETGARVIISFGSTGMLTKQIKEGAPFDVFFAADVESIDELKKGGFIMPDSVELYAQGSLVLAVNKASGIQAVELSDLLKPEIRHVAIANPEFAPYGKAAKEALQAKGLWESVKPRLVYGENIRQTLQYIQTGNAEAGIVALSIAGVPEVL
jgi:molybdate transport system substrate-binding protein